MTELINEIGVGGDYFHIDAIFEATPKINPRIKTFMGNTVNGSVREN